MDRHYKITLHSLAHRAPGASAPTSFADSNLPLPVIVDSGTTLSLLPESLVGKLAAQFPGATSDGNGGYRVDCAFQSRDGSVAFEFLSGNGTVVINVAYRDFIWNSGGDCFLGAWFTDDLGIWILGDTFLRGAYGESHILLPPPFSFFFFPRSFIFALSCMVLSPKPSSARSRFHDEFSIANRGRCK